MPLGTQKAVVIGAGVGGLVAALGLALAGLAVTVVEQAALPGGKMRTLDVDGARIDAGPTVFTMREVFEVIFADAGATLSDHLTLRPCRVLARHAWADGGRLDLFADPAQSADAVGALCGAAEARGFLAFSRHAQRVYEALDGAFIRAEAPRMTTLLGRAGLSGLAALLRTSPFASLWQVLGRYFRDPRLRQLFARYATYCGSSPFEAPAILMLIAHVEREGVWLVEGGMHRLAQALADLARRRGVAFRYDTMVRGILIDGGRAAGVRLDDGEAIDADIVVVNADAAAVGAGMLGRAVADAAPAMTRAERSLSAVTWAMRAEITGFPLSRHNVFFSADYKAEFDDLITHRRLPREPTVYVCAQDRDDDDRGDAPRGPERLLCLVNAPADGDAVFPDPSEIAQCEERTFRLLERCGLTVSRSRDTMAVTTPAAFARMFPGTGGALYGRATHGWRASFLRPTARTRVPGLYLAGGSTHPGAGVPMAALSGQLAAACATADLASTRPWRKAAMPGGMSTR